ncbi:MAG: type II toxin-antitoxin system VapC family toxin [Acidobacteriota bacterium]
MVIDSSVAVAIFLNEADWRFLHGQILRATTRFISAVSIVETGIVLESRLGATAVRDFERYRKELRIEIVAVDAETAQGALAAWRKYGKGRHRAALNLGDCFSYALAKSTAEPLLAKGDDFARTDLELCPQVPPTQ